MPRLIDATLVLLGEESACQQVESDGDIDEDDTEHDEVLMDAVSDLLPAFAKAMGSYFAPIFAKLFEPLMKFSVSWLLGLIVFQDLQDSNLLTVDPFSILFIQRASRPPQDRTMVVACLAEVAQDMGAPIAAYVDVTIHYLRSFHFCFFYTVE